VPHVGDMGQIDQHLVLFNHIALGHEALFLETIPHLREHFVQPARVENGTYVTPEVPGVLADLRGISLTFNRPGSSGLQDWSMP
jgi:L-fuconate dehydratase